MAKAGWYPDPGGGVGLYRYWDGKAWSAVTSTNAAAAPPTQGLVGNASTPARPGAETMASHPASYGQNPTGYGPNAAGGDYHRYQQLPAKKNRYLGWWIGIGAVVVVLVVVIVLVVRNVTGGGGVNNPTGGGSEDACPSVSSTPTAAPHAAGDGRVHGGPISYPELGSPWGPPQSDDRVPFGTDVLTQNVTIEANYDNNSSWVASVLVGQLIAGDGFYSPQQGSEIVVRCIVGVFYGGAQVTRDDSENKAMTVDGHDAWIVRTHLTFDIPNLKTKGETATIVIINAGATAGIYYSSIPDTSTQLQAPADQVLAELSVD